MMDIGEYILNLLLHPRKAAIMQRWSFDDTKYLL
jgi:hypothetical protein